jgi:hypothetical protein
LFKTLGWLVKNKGDRDSIAPSASYERVWIAFVQIFAASLVLAHSLTDSISGAIAPFGRKFWLTLQATLEILALSLCFGHEIF